MDSVTIEMCRKAFLAYCAGKPTHMGLVHIYFVLFAE